MRSRQVKADHALGVDNSLEIGAGGLSHWRRARRFLQHAPGGIIAAYRKCTHLGCTVPFNTQKDLFECPCHGSRYDKYTATVLRTPAPRPLDLFHISEQANGLLIVDTNPLTALTRSEWDPRQLEIRE